MEWISVKDRLPEEGEYVLIYQGGDVFLDYEKCMVAHCHSKNLRWYTECCKSEAHVTHWMPLPSKPEGTD